MFSLFSKAAILAAASLCLGLPATSQIGSLPAHTSRSGVSAVEYFFDADPGYGAGTPLSVSPASDITATPAIPITTLDRGAHRLFIRSRNSSGQWSMTHSQVLVIYSLLQALPQAVQGTQVAAAEYFVDTDPGMGQGTPVALPGPGADLSAANVAVDISGLGLGLHRVFFRTRNTAGQWSLGHGSTFTILINTIGRLPAHAAARPITAVEYFIDTDPGYGNGTIIPVAATADLANQTVAVDISGLARGTHTLFFRSINGHSMTTAQSFSIGGTALPLSWLDAGVRADGAAADIHWELVQTARTESFTIERSADGRNFTTIGVTPAQGGAGRASYRYLDPAPVYGGSFYRIRLNEAGEAPSYSPVLALRSREQPAEIRLSNPVSQTLSIRRIGDGAAELDLSIRDLSGREVAHPGRGDVMQSVDLSAVPAGMYLLCWEQDGRQQTRKFIKL